MAAGSSTVYGADSTFTTLSVAPAVTTSAATGVSATGATLNGSLTSLGSASSVTVSFQYGTTTSYGSTASVSPARTATGSFSAAISGLSASTTYHFRAVATGDGTVNGADMSFTTPAAPISYATTIAPILSANCMCHVTLTQAPRLNTYSAVVSASSALPGMGSSYLTAAQTQAIADWIAGGMAP